MRNKFKGKKHNVQIIIDTIVKILWFLVGLGFRAITTKVQVFYFWVIHILELKKKN